MAWASRARPPTASEQLIQTWRSAPILPQQDVMNSSPDAAGLRVQHAFGHQSSDNIMISNNLMRMSTNLLASRYFGALAPSGG